MRSHLRRFIICLLAVSFASLQIAPASAGLVGTQTLIDQVAQRIDRERLKDTLERGQVRKLLADHGVSMAQAEERIDALTDEEVSQLAAHFDEEPAGGVIEIVIIAALIVVILELVGITDIFTQF